MIAGCRARRRRWTWRTDDAGYLAKLQDYYARWRSLPAYGPLQVVLGLASRSAVAKVLHRLRDAGYLERHPEATFLMRVTGDSWTEAGLHDGDLLVMDRVTQPLAGSVALTVVEGASVLTRLSRDAQGRLRVQAAGTDLSRPLDDAITMAGVARWVIHRLWPGRVSS